MKKNLIQTLNRTLSPPPYTTLPLLIHTPPPHHPFLCLYYPISFITLPPSTPSHYTPLSLNPFSFYTPSSLKPFSLYPSLHHTLLMIPLPFSTSLFFWPSKGGKVGEGMKGEGVDGRRGAERYMVKGS